LNNDKKLNLDPLNMVLNHQDYYQPISPIHSAKFLKVHPNKYLHDNLTYIIRAITKFIQVSDTNMEFKRGIVL